MTELEDQVIFKIYDITAWLTNTFYTYIAQYLTKWRQPYKEIWSDNRVKQETYFSSKIMQKIRGDTSSRPLFVF